MRENVEVLRSNNAIIKGEMNIKIIIKPSK